MLKTKQLLARFGKDFPKHLAKKHHDYVGLMSGVLPLYLKRVLVVLDLEFKDLDAVVSLKPDLILTHHPFIYGSRAKVLASDEKKRQMVDTLNKHGIAVYSLHTNFDEGHGGMNDVLARQLQLQAIHPLKTDPIARGGTLLQPMPVEAFARYAKEKLNVPYGWLIAEGKSMISTVAIVGGGGARDYIFAMQEGYDIFISGDAPHHVRRSIVNDRFNYLELPHEIEMVFLETIRQYLLNLDNNLEVFTPFNQTLPRLI
jgi:dinuclear metal center YbgI/SA1388 family protein